MNKQIIPHYGFDQFRLGVSINEIESVLGEATEVLNETYADNSEDKILNYKDIGVDFVFSSDNDFLLGTITFKSSDYSLKKEKLIGLCEKDFIKKMTGMKITDLSLEDDFTELNSKDYYSDINGLSFWIQDGIVDSISVFPKYKKDDETPIWPN